MSTILVVRGKNQTGRSSRSRPSAPDETRRRRDARLHLRSLGSSVSGLCRAQTAGANYAPEIFASEKMRYTRMEYLIAIGVVAMMALYVVIIARCLNEPEWQ
jgi:hypothetical protein